MGSKEYYTSAERLDFVKVKNLCTSKYTIKREHRQTTEGEKIFETLTSKGPIALTIRKRTDTPIRKRQPFFGLMGKRHLGKDSIQIVTTL